MRVAAIDVGTNSVRALAVEFDIDSVHILNDSGEITRLGAGLMETGRILPDDAERTEKVLETCLARLRELEIEQIDLVGTEVFRAAENGRDVAGSFSSKLGHALRILSSDDEAEAAYLGVVGWEDMSDPTPTLVIDVGGGSTQVVSGEGIALNRSRSFPVGALRLTAAHLKHDPPRPAEIEAARKAAARAFKTVTPFSTRARPPRAVGVGGTICAIGAWINQIVPYDAARVDGGRVTIANLKKAVAEWGVLSLAERMEKGGLSEGRARVVPGGGLVIETLLETLGLPGIEVSTRGIRHGVVLRRVLLA